MLKKRSFTIARHRTSIALEPEFWKVLERLAAARGLSLARLVAEIDAAKQGGLASALRVHALLRIEALMQKNGPRGAKPMRPKSGESI
ncbi:MAG TPA: ribbon-helix-helix domain-containing protein [Alphaproteobacteria bacterium]|jgi:predicted DNA-binding ribbon-helix-helix protein